MTGKSGEPESVAESADAAPLCIYRDCPRDPEVAAGETRRIQRLSRRAQFCNKRISAVEVSLKTRDMPFAVSVWNRINHAVGKVRVSVTGAVARRTMEANHENEVFMEESWEPAGRARKSRQRPRWSQYFRSATVPRSVLGTPPTPLGDWPPRQVETRLKQFIESVMPWISVACWMLLPTVPQKLLPPDALVTFGNVVNSTTCRIFIAVPPQSKGAFRRIPEGKPRCLKIAEGTAFTQTA